MVGSLSEPPRQPDTFGDLLRRHLPCHHEHGGFGIIVFLSGGEAEPLLCLAETPLHAPAFAVTHAKIALGFSISLFRFVADIGQRLAVCLPLLPRWRRARFLVTCAARIPEPVAAPRQFARRPSSFAAATVQPPSNPRCSRSGPPGCPSGGLWPAQLAPLVIAQTRPQLLSTIRREAGLPDQERRRSIHEHSVESAAVGAASGIHYFEFVGWVGLVHKDLPGQQVATGLDRPSMPGLASDQKTHTMARKRD